VRPRLIALTATAAWLKDNGMKECCLFDEVLGKSSNLDGLMCAVDRHPRSSPNPATRRAAALLPPIGQAA
jgi:hypothetical protein